MTVNDPIYTVTVSNESAGWSYTTTQGDAYNPALDVQLADGLTMSWGFNGGDLFNMLDVEQVSCALYVAEATDLPDCEQGHILTVALDRGPGIPYMHFAGRITDVEADTDPTYGTVVTLLASDPTSELTAEHADAYLAGQGGMSPDADQALSDAFETYYMAQAYAMFMGPYAGSPLPVRNDHFGRHAWNYAGTLRDYAARVVAGTPEAGVGALNLRYAYAPDWPGVWTDFDNWNIQGNSFGIPPVPPPPWMFYMQDVSGRIEDTFDAPYVYGFDPADPDRVTVSYDPSVVGEDAVTILDGDFIATPQKWRKDRTTAPNDIRFSWSPLGNPPGEPVPVEVKDQPSIDRSGYVTRNVETVLLSDLTVTAPSNDPASAILEANPSPDRWAADSVVIMPEHMPSDAVLDELATHFYPHSQPSESVLGRPCIVTNISPNILLAEKFHYAVIVGCTFNVSGGKLRIVPQLQPIAMLIAEADSPSPTFTAWTASAYGNATFADQGGSADYIDPAMTLDLAAVAAL